MYVCVSERDRPGTEPTISLGAGCIAQQQQHACTSTANGTTTCSHLTSMFFILFLFLFCCRVFHTAYPCPNPSLPPSSLHLHCTSRLRHHSSSSSTTTSPHSVPSGYLPVTALGSPKPSSPARSSPSFSRQLLRTPRAVHVVRGADYPLKSLVCGCHPSTCPKFPSILSQSSPIHPFLS